MSDLGARVAEAVDLSTVEKGAYAAGAGRGRRQKRTTILQTVVCVLLLALSFVPIGLMISMSLRRTAMIYADFWRLPIPPYWRNYEVTLFELTMPLVRTLWLYLMTITFMLLFGSLAGYAFARIDMFGREFMMYFLVLAVMMIPGVITLAPRFVLMSKMQLRGELWGLALSYVARGQPFSIFLLSTFFAAQPAEMFESARVDGASEWQSMFRIAMPLARPILVTIAIMNFLSIYGDLIWPSLMLTFRNSTMILALMEWNPQVSEEMHRPDLGPLTAGYVFASIPPLIMFIVGMRYYIAGLTSGAIKG